MSAQEPLVKIGTILDMSGHQMPITAITAKGVTVQHQGGDLAIGREAVEVAVTTAK